MGKELSTCRRRQKRKTLLLGNLYWKLGMIEYFQSEDINKDGYVTIEEMVENTKPFLDHCDATPLKMETLENAVRLFWGEVGLVPGKRIGRRRFLRGLSELGRLEVQREHRGMPTLHNKVANALFDIIDANNNNQLTEIEIGNWMAACGLDRGEAGILLQEADRKQKGFITREELIESEFCSFFHPEKCMVQLGIRVVKEV
uniref:Putative photoprotein-like protein n=1 Tax=Dryodora glandiformis TaxID=1566677 RepID=A0A0A0RVY6_9METZ|nr:putative photoprotein-like protein [Dryodora glandiformis]